jgi:hypothetical protein
VQLPERTNDPGRSDDGEQERCDGREPANRGGLLAAVRSAQPEEQRCEAAHPRRRRDDVNPLSEDLGSARGGRARVPGRDVRVGETGTPGRSHPEPRPRFLAGASGDEDRDGGRDERCGAPQERVSEWCPEQDGEPGAARGPLLRDAQRDETRRAGDQRPPGQADQSFRRLRERGRRDPRTADDADQPEEQTEAASAGRAGR